jgi:hypothetical protein
MTTISDIEVGSTITIQDVPDKRGSVFRLRTFEEFCRFCNVIAAKLRKGKALHIEIIDDERYKLTKIRAAYFCWLGEKYGEAGHDGRSVDQMHMEYKSAYLLRILCARDLGFADLFHKMTVGGIEEKTVMDLLSVADSSITTSEIMREYFTACQRGGWDKGAE